MEKRQLNGIEQITASGNYLIGGRFVVKCVEQAPAFFCAIVLDLENHILGKAVKQGPVWGWHPAQSDGAGGVAFPDLSTDLLEVDGHLLPPLGDVVGMTSMMVTERERAAIMAFRGEVSNAVQD